MTTFAQVHTAAVNLLDTISGLTVSKEVPTRVFPAAWVNPIPEPDYRDSLHGDTLYVAEIVVLAGDQLNEHQLKLQPYLERSGAQSIFALFEANRGLGFSDVDVHVRSGRSLGFEEASGYGAFGAALTLVISISG